MGLNLNKVVIVSLATLLLSACASQTPAVSKNDSQYSIEAQQKAQQKATVETVIEKPTLKRKLALGRITNETMHGKSLLRDNQDDVLGKQVTDMLSKSLSESGNFLVFERPDLGRLQSEAALTGNEMELVGVDTLIIGSLTEFGRKTVGEKGFLSSSKKQVAFAKVDLRLVDVKTGHIYTSISGSGEASTEAASVAGFGSRASYDGTLNDSAINNAISDAVNALSQKMLTRPWKADVLAIEDGVLFISGGKSQGLHAGITLSVMTKGKKVKSKQTGTTITLPGKPVGTIEVQSVFGETVLEEGSVAIPTKGDFAAYSVDQLVVMENK